MTGATPASQGQMMAPTDVRRATRVSGGDRIEFVEVGAGRSGIVAGVAGAIPVAGPRA